MFTREKIDRLVDAHLLQAVTVSQWLPLQNSQRKSVQISTVGHPPFFLGVRTAAQGRSRQIEGIRVAWMQTRLSMECEVPPEAVTEESMCC